MWNSSLFEILLCYAHRALIIKLTMQHQQRAAKGHALNQTKTNSPNAYSTTFEEFTLVPLTGLEPVRF